MPTKTYSDDPRAVYMRAWSKKNPDKSNANKRKTWQRHGSKYLATRKAEYASSADVRAKAVERSTKWQRENKERRKAYMEKYYADHREKFCKKTADWKGANPERRKINAIHYAAKRRQRIGEAVNDPLIKKMLARERQKKSHRCYFCRKSFRGVFHLDHVRPVSQGGKHEMSNVAVACPECNQTKADKELGQFAADNQRLLAV